MRSQLDGIDSRLPGTGVFDIKTRAAVPIRQDLMNYPVSLVWPSDQYLFNCRDTGELRISDQNSPRTCGELRERIF
jgi:hypothetical protein